MNLQYTRYHPKWYRARMPIFWWLRSLAYVRFITRELTSVFVAYIVVLLLVYVRALALGGETWTRLIEWLQAPAVVAFHGVALAALLFHTITWLSLAPKALTVRLGGRRLSPKLIGAVHYAAWLGASVVLAWGLIGGP